MKIARPGWRYIAFGLGAAFVGWIIAGFAVTYGFGVVVQAAGVFFALACAYFFRDPQRELSCDPAKLYSPGDGTVLSVDQEDGATVLRVFLSVLDVHIQRAPCAGTVEKVTRHAGTFAPAMKDDAKSNARCEIALRPEGGREPLVVEQITGILARRIECWAKEGDSLAAGQRYGIIHFGSQVAVRFPALARCTVKPGDKVFGGVTVVGEWIEKT